MRILITLKYNVKKISSNLNYNVKMIKMVEEILINQLNNTLKETNFKLGELYRGKVRDNYILNDLRIIIATDRASAFDRVITTIPSKGQMLNQISSFWFEMTKHIAKNHFIESPDVNVSVVKQCDTIPIEMIVRGYITGSMWRDHKIGKATSGIRLPSSIKENQKLDDLILTPSTKAETGHDIYISREQILKENMVERGIYEEIEEIALRLFKFGQEFCLKNGIILVDTKYEFGVENGELLIIDEIHTQDSSRFWFSNSYEERFSKGEDPEMLDKEIFRKWLMKEFPSIFPNISPEQETPLIPPEIRIELAKKYIRSYEKITNSKFVFADPYKIEERIAQNLSKYL
jgi:phosphoribosylaminoimidazole-succinocarboxamide synthase